MSREVVMHQVPGSRLKGGVVDGLLYLEGPAGKVVMLVEDARALASFLHDILPAPPVKANPEDRW